MKYVKRQYRIVLCWILSCAMVQVLFCLLKDIFISVIEAPTFISQSKGYLPYGLHGSTEILQFLT